MSGFISNPKWSGSLKTVPLALSATLANVQQSPLDESRNKREKLRAGLGGVGGKFWFLPLADAASGETAAQRLAYRQMLRDSTIKAALLSKFFGVGVLDTSVKPASDKPLDKEACDFVTYCLDRVEGQLLGLAEHIILPGLIEGYSLSEKVWQVEDRQSEFTGKIICKAVKSKHPDTYLLMGDEYTNVTTVRGQQYNAGEEWPIGDFVLWRNLQLYNSTHGMSDLRAAYSAYVLKDTAKKLRIIHLEKWSTPYLYATYKNIEDKPGLDAQLEQAKGQTFITAPDGVLVQALDLSVKGTADYASAIADLDREIMLGITGAFLQSLEGEKTGARSIGEVHQDSAELPVWYLQKHLCNVLNEQWIPDLIKLNYPAGTGYPQIGLGGINDGELAASLAIDEGLQRLGLPLSMAELYTKYNRQRPTDAADTLTPPLPTAGPPGGGFAEDTPAAPPTKYEEMATKMIMERMGLNGVASNGHAA